MNATRTLATALLLAATAAPLAAQDSFNWRGRVANGQTLEIKGINGNITASRGTEVRVSAEKRARRSNPDEVRIEVVEHSGGVTICAVYPAPANREPNECRPGNGGRMNNQRNDTQVDFTVEVPAGVVLAARTVNGGVTATGLASTVRAVTVNGDIEISTSSVATAHTVNGTIDVDLGPAEWNSDLDFESVNGSIVLALTSGINANVEASTVNGGIETDFPLTVRGRFGPRRVSGTIGQGGPTLSLSTVNGSIEIRRR